jgi:hypothetical protein
MPQVANPSRGQTFTAGFFGVRVLTGPKGARVKRAG